MDEMSWYMADGNVKAVAQRLWKAGVPVATYGMVTAAVAPDMAVMLGVLGVISTEPVYDPEIVPCGDALGGELDYNGVNVAPFSCIANAPTVEFRA